MAAIILGVVVLLWALVAYQAVEGAGMARASVAAAFVRTKMPLGRGGSLDEQDAWDLAAFMTGAPRPAFAGGAKDYPKGGVVSVKLCK